MKKNSISDEILVERFRAGDDQAFGLLIERYSSTVAQIIFPKVKDSLLTEDLSQDVFIKAMKALRAGSYTEVHFF